MQFVRLRLNGFKSFVDPTDLAIADGLTGIVGPNGCGKSNLLEALRWVMGETRPKAMRGGGMEDVIFAGAASRPARNFAEVSLSVDNSERRAPAAVNDADMLEVVRRITREAGSAYRCNGREMRARDVQMLFADAATGAQSPALVRQGQIAELIAAQPLARRRVLEDAAGISGLHQRRHEAELRLKATEANLDRVQDSVDALAAQLGTLARQARAAARYRAIGADLRRAEWRLLYRRWRGAADVLDAARAAAQVAVRAAARSDAEARTARAAREAAEAALPPLREEETVAAAILQRALVARDGLDAEAAAATERIATLEARAAQIAADRAREDGLRGDAAQTLQRLAAEATGLAAAQEGHAARLAASEQAADEATGALSEREAALGALTEAVASLAARHEAVDRQAREARAASERAGAAARKAGAAAEAARHDAAGSASREAAAAEAQEAAQAALVRAEALAQTAAQALSAGEAEAASAMASHGAAAAEAAALSSEVAALQGLLAPPAGAQTGGAPVIEGLRVAPGLERALAAAFGETLALPNRTDGETGAGWRQLAPLAELPPLPDAAAPLAPDVSAPGPLGRAVPLVGVVPAAAGAELQAALAPGQVLVSRDGAVWRWDGYTAPAGGAPSEASRRLEQRNRLAALEVDLAAATDREARAGAVRAAAAAARDEAARAAGAARAAMRAAEREHAEAGRARIQAETAAARAMAEAERQERAASAHGEVVAEAQAALAAAEADRTGLEDLDALRADLAAQRQAVEAARMAAMARRAALDEDRRAGESRARRLQAIGREQAAWRTRGEQTDARQRDLARRAEETEAALLAARAVPADLEKRRAAMAQTLSAAQARKAAAEDARSGAEAVLRTASAEDRDAAAAAAQAREARARAETRVEAAEAGAAAAAARLREETGETPEGLLAALDEDGTAIPSAEALETEMARLRRSREAMGAVNLRAEQDAAAVQGEHDTLVAEAADLAAATARLREGIAGLNREGRERLLTAFEAVNGNFSTLFPHLFGGGEARLTLVESDDPLEAGLEILCQPPGKHLSTLSLLSGGEQTLTALALIFAVFLANPAPICVLDEVDAPLDDANVVRFCDLLDEMTRRTRTRFLIITHHAVTMARMDRLYGVTMAEHGVSQLVSVDLRKAEKLVA